MPDYIFHDPTGKRARRTGLAGGLLVALAALMVAGFFATLAFAPRLPAVELQDPRVLTALHQETAHRLKRGDKPAWTRIPRPQEQAKGRWATPQPTAQSLSLIHI